MAATQTVAWRRDARARRRRSRRAPPRASPQPRAAPTPDWLTDLVESLEKKIDLRVRLRRGRRTAEGGFEKGQDVYRYMDDLWRAHASGSIAEED